MTQFKGTKGKWNQSHRITDKDGNYSTEVYCDKGQTIATLSWYPNNDIKGVTTTDREANAKLIAAAPELLKALVFLKQEYEQLVDCGDCGDWNPRQDNCIVLAKEAINKALN